MSEIEEDEVKLWKGDLLDRKSEGEFIKNYLLGRYSRDSENPFVLNINAEWGYGKSFFLKNLALELRENNNLVIEFDAWKNDYTKEPLLAFMAEVNNTFESFFVGKPTKSREYFSFFKKNGLPILLSILSRKLTGFTLDELAELEEEPKEEQDGEKKDDENDDILNGVSSLTTKLAEFALKEHNTIKENIAHYKKNLKRLLESIAELDNMNLPLFILIDELDRCRPNYAIELLENIKHLFDIKGVYFVIATDSKQLSHSINAIYGEKFSSEDYLKRFFDQEYRLKTPETIDFLTKLFTDNNILNDTKMENYLDLNFYNSIDNNILLFKMMVDLFELKPRDIIHIFNSLLAIRDTFPTKHTICLPYMLSLLIIKYKSSEYFDSFIQNKNIQDIAVSKLNLNFDSYYVEYSNFSGQKKYIRLIEYLQKFASVAKQTTGSDLYSTINGNDIEILGGFYVNILNEGNSKSSVQINTILSQYQNMVIYAGQIL